MKDRRVVFFRARLGLALAAFMLVGCLCGCVTRRLTIRSNPPGAHVYIDDYNIGSTPISHNFIYYGTRKISLIKDGYETLSVMQKIPTPWYEIPPLDFVSENCIPGEIRDHRTITYQLTPQCVVPHDQLLGRAENLRGQVQGPRSIALPPGAVPVGSAPVGSMPPPVGNQMLPNANPLPPPSGAPIPPPWNAVPPASNPIPPAGNMQPPPGFGPR